MENTVGTGTTVEIGNSLVLETRGPEETRALGALLAQALAPGDFVALDGELASGKTCLVQGMGFGLGFGGPVTSPTFTLLHIYEGGRLPLYHFDVYRLSSPTELENIGYEEYFYGDGVCVVEWGGLAADYLPSRRIGLVMERAEGSSLGGLELDAETRRITVTLYGGDDAGWDGLLAATSQINRRG
jgi:tRNA threonylcarbamoyladenosine biosynthesis protein TsaE